MLTKNQQQTIQFITEQFNRLNEQQQPRRNFKLVDVQPLENITEKIKATDEEEKLNYEMWRKLAYDERDRIVSLLSEDLPMNRVRIKTNYTCSMMSICRVQKYWNGNEFAEYISDHHDECVKIDVVIEYKDSYDDLAKKYRKYGTRLKYQLNYNRKIDYNTIEELCSTDEFKDTLRKRVL